MIGSSGFYNLIVGTFNSRRAQAPAVNYIRKTFRVKLNTLFIPGYVPIGCELSNGVKEGSCTVIFLVIYVVTCMYICIYVHNMRHLFKKS